MRSRRVDSDYFLPPSSSLRYASPAFPAPCAILREVVVVEALAVLRALCGTEREK